MKICLKCNKEYEMGSFCTICGSKLVDMDDVGDDPIMYEMEDTEDESPMYELEDDTSAYETSQAGNSSANFFSVAGGDDGPGVDKASGLTFIIIGAAVLLCCLVFGFFIFQHSKKVEDKLSAENIESIGDLVNGVTDKVSSGSEAATENVGNGSVWISSNKSYLECDVKKTAKYKITIEGASRDEIYFKTDFDKELVKVKWGKWKGKKARYATITGRKAGSGTLTVNVYNKETDELLAATQIDYVVNDPVAAEIGIHSYSFFVEDITWKEAYEKAAGKGGYLVHINSREEYDYILKEISRQGYDKIQFLIGGRRSSDGKAYYWVDSNNKLYGDKLNASDYWASGEWHDGEPSFKDGNVEEKYMDIFYNSTKGRWGWNDVPNDIVSVVSYFSGKIGYIVEYE